METPTRAAHDASDENEIRVRADPHAMTIERSKPITPWSSNPGVARPRPVAWLLCFATGVAGACSLTLSERPVDGSAGGNAADATAPRSKDAGPAGQGAAAGSFFTIWMAAIDLRAEPGMDPSQLAFYISGQELHGTNSRPFFALDPCVSDAGVCGSGIDCCTGFCRDGYCVPPPEKE